MEHAFLVALGGISSTNELACDRLTLRGAERVTQIVIVRATD
jgi:hypothetical protein